MKTNPFYDFVEKHQGFALGFLIAALAFPNKATRSIGILFVFLLIANRFYQIRLKYLKLSKGGLKNA
jgi:hypothetical protein